MAFAEKQHFLFARPKPWSLGHTALPSATRHALGENDAASWWVPEGLGFLGSVDRNRTTTMRRASTQSTSWTSGFTHTTSTHHTQVTHTATERRG